MKNVRGERMKFSMAFSVMCFAESLQTVFNNTCFTVICKVCKFTKREKNNKEGNCGDILGDGDLGHAT